MRTVRDHAPLVVRVLALVGTAVATVAPTSVAAQDGGEVPPGCRVLETYPPQVVCDPAPGDPGGGGNAGSDDPVCASPAGEIDCGPVPPPGGDDCPGQTDPSGGCAVPGNPGLGGGDGGCDPAVDPGCGIVVEVPPPVVDDPGNGAGESPPCPADWTSPEGGCEIPIGTLPGDDGSCDPAAGDVCAAPYPGPPDDGVVQDDPCGAEAAQHLADCGSPGDSACGELACAPPIPDAPVTGGIPQANPPPDAPAGEVPIPEAGPWVSVRRLAAEAAAPASLPVAVAWVTWLVLLLP